MNKLHKNRIGWVFNKLITPINKRKVENDEKSEQMNENSSNKMDECSEDLKQQLRKQHFWLWFISYDIGVPN